MLNGFFMCKGTQSLKKWLYIDYGCREGLDQDSVCEGGNRGSPLGEAGGKHPGGCCGARGMGGGES